MKEDEKEIDDIVAPIPQAKMNIWLIAFVSLGTILVVGVIAFFIGFLGNSPQYNPANKTTQPSSVDLRIKGNRNSKIYHLPGCPNYDDIAERNIVWFKTHDEAKQAGYRMAKNCP